MFKRPKRHRIYGVIQKIATNIQEAQWRADAIVPDYILVSVQRRDGGEEVWTNESKLTWLD